MSLILEIKVIPLAGFNQWKIENNRLKCYLKSAAQKGKANNELRELLSAALGMPMFKIVIISGATSRLKRVKIEREIGWEEILYKLGVVQQMKLFNKEK